MAIPAKRGRPGLATVNRRKFQCMACECNEFIGREIVLNTPGAELLGFAWANKSATGLVCQGCGFVHEFVGQAAELWDPAGGLPEPS